MSCGLLKKKKFNSYQLNYSVIEKEALGLILALKHFDVYINSSVGPLVVFTDHNPLTFLHSLQNPNQRLMRWSLFLHFCIFAGISSRYHTH